MDIRIEKAEAKDAEALVSIQRKAFERLYKLYQDEGSPYLRGEDEIAVWLSRPNWHVYKIYLGEMLCGGVAFCERRETPGVYYLARIYISPELQGKGIASTAILLCEKTVSNANLWTLDYPADQPANRRCYEKAGYEDTGERREQSGGAVTLAYMEKHVPPIARAEELGILYPIILTDYNPDWPKWYAEERGKIVRIIGAENISSVRHYGSTSIPGMFAKPTIDILVEIPENANIARMKSCMKNAGYRCLDGNALTMPAPPPHMMFLGGYGDTGFDTRVFHIHVQYISENEPDEILFRDYLIAHPNAAKEYAGLKRALWKEFEHDRDGYTEAKGEFVRRITKKAKEERL